MHWREPCERKAGRASTCPTEAGGCDWGSGVASSLWTATKEKQMNSSGDWFQFELSTNLIYIICTVCIARRTLIEGSHTLRKNIPLIFLFREEDSDRWKIKFYTNHILCLRAGNVGLHCFPLMKIHSWDIPLIKDMEFIYAYKICMYFNLCILTGYVSILTYGPPNRMIK